MDGNKVLKPETSIDDKLIENPNHISDRINNILEILSRGLYERNEIIKKTFLAFIAGESIFYYGPPGVAKSLISRRLKKALKNATSFEYLMNRFSTPEEIFGPISIAKLRDEDKLERKVENYLPNSHVAFLDEIWKAGPSIQNTLLTIINERIYRNGTQTLKVPLITLISASNELPEKNQGLEALWDRFIFRVEVDNVEDYSSFSGIMTTHPRKLEIDIDQDLQFTSEELGRYQDLIHQVKVPQAILKMLFELRKIIQKFNQANYQEIEPIYVSDRRWKKIVHILKSSAFGNGRDEVDLMDCMLVEDMIWSEIEHRDHTKEMILNASRSYFTPLTASISELEKAIEDFRSNFQSSNMRIAQRMKIVSCKDKYNIFHIEVKPAQNCHEEVEEVCYIYNWHDKFNLNWVPRTGDTIGLCGSNFNHIETVKIINTEFGNEKLEFTINYHATKLLIKTSGNREYRGEIRTQMSLGEIKQDLIELENRVDIKRDRDMNNFASNLFVDDTWLDEIAKVYDTILGQLSQLHLRIEEIEYSIEKSGNVAQR